LIREYELKIAKLLAELESRARSVIESVEIDTIVDFHPAEPNISVVVTRRVVLFCVNDERAIDWHWEKRL